MCNGFKDVLKKQSIIKNTPRQLGWYQMIRAIAFLCYLSFFVSTGDQGLTRKFLNISQEKLYQPYSLILSEVDEEPHKFST